MNTADKCREMGLQVGDTIEGEESNKISWSITRLTLLFLGESIAVWRETSKSSHSGWWSKPTESSGWSLKFREWRKVSFPIKRLEE